MQLNKAFIFRYKIYKEKQENYKKTQILKVSIEKIFKLADF